MLIYTSKSPGWGKQKPKQWGPLSAVRSAVRHNAERMGIDPISIGRLYPIFENAGQDVSGIGNTLSIESLGAGTPSLFHSGFDCGYISSTSFGCLNGASFDLKEQQTLLVIANANRNTTYAGILGCGGYSTGWSVYWYAAQIARLMFGGPYSISSDTDLLDTNGSSTSLCVVRDNSSARIVKNGEQWGHDRTVSSGVISSDGNDFRLGARSNASNSMEYGFDGVYHFAAIFDCVLNDSQIAQLHETPYALLQPVPQTYVFDMGASLVPSLISPTNGITGLDQPINFEWSAVSGASNYQLQIDESSGDFSTPVVDDATLTGTTKEVSGLSDSMEYKWRVRADV